MRNKNINYVSNIIPEVLDIASQYNVEVSDDFYEIMINGMTDSLEDDYENTMETIKAQISSISSVIQNNVYRFYANIDNLEKEKAKIELDDSISDADKNRNIADILDAMDSANEKFEADRSNKEKVQEAFIQILKNEDNEDNDVHLYLAQNALEYMLVNSENASLSKYEQAKKIIQSIMASHAGGMSASSGASGAVGRGGFDTTAFWAAHMQNLVGRIGPNVEYPIEEMPSFFFEALKNIEPHPLLVDYMNTAYQAQQAQYEKENVSTLELYRGRRPDSPPRGIPLEPWSTEKAVAESFGTVDDEFAMPVSYILYDHRSGSLLPNEFEYLVLGWAYWNWKWAKEQAKKK